MSFTRRMNKRSGTTIVEILVVIVVFLVGVLGVAQIFPRGLGILRTTRNNAVSNNLARAEMQRMIGQGEQLAEAILPVTYIADGAGFATQIDLTRRPNDLIPAGATIDNAGIMSVGSVVLGDWKRFSGANTVRRVIGEGKKVPGPRFVPYNAGPAAFGSVMSLQFGPIVNGLGATSPVSVYGNDMQKNYVETIPTNRGLAAFDYFLTDDGTEIALPGSTVARGYRIAMNYVETATGVTRTAILGPITVPAGPGQTVNTITVQSLVGVAAYAEVDTVRVQRMFAEVADPLAFTNGAPEDSAYEFCILDRSIGTLMFNKAGFGYIQKTRRARAPLVARVDYDVFDWRIIREDFRVPTDGRPYRLAMQSLKVKGNPDIDGLPYPGLGFTVRSGGIPAVAQRDFLLVDLESGGIVMESAIQLDKSLGVVTVKTTGNDLNMIFSGPTSVPVHVDLAGRSLRALYMGRQEFAVQVSKAASEYIATDSASLGYKQCYMGNTGAFPVGNATEIYFPLCDIGKKVILGELWYWDGTATRSAFDQEFEIHPPHAGDAVTDMAHVDIQEIFPAATTLDFSNGYAVRRVRGASVDVRVSWNPSFLKLGPTPADTMVNLDKWTQTTRKSDAENFLVRGVSQ
ncbi:MAG: hypothetical protein K8R88_10600 [Armatimonadetes bacterium]|nr:hypothetical protein [Armatimonadota bacterium]